MNHPYGNSYTRSWIYTKENSEKKSELDEPKTEEYMEQTKRHKKRRIDSKPKESQSIPTQGTDDEIPESTKEEQSKKNEGRNSTARPQKQEEFNHKVEPLIIKETAKWTKTSNMMNRKNITATKCKLIQTGIQVEPTTEDDYRKLSKILKE
ncbi:hypothetical protein Trydic_g4701 [Trypoxylus dichotomus]